MNMMIYMDNAATTKMRREVVEAMLPFMTSEYGNPSANYEFAGRAKNAIEKARADIAGTLNCEPEEIYFTSGGTESDNWVIKSKGLESRHGHRNHVITSLIEHHAVLNACHYIEKRNADVSYVGTDSMGVINLIQLEDYIKTDTSLISVMAANNEIGTIEPIKKIGEIAREHNIAFHTDAVQAYTNIKLDMQKLPVDFLSVSAHKINGPKGAGFLYARKGCDIMSFMDGGAQERGRRAGTENVSAIVGLARAAVIACRQMEQKVGRECKIRDYMISRIQKEIPNARLNGHPVNRLPNNINFSFERVDGGTLVAMLDQQNICASSGSACTSSSKEPSHVLKAIGLSDELANGAVRLTINEIITKQEADYVINCLKYNIKKLQSVD
ncbi:MAG: cysteine desulfurase family protein [Eubacteriales bacterium]|nr:cysteine desulfurase family protein [Eubacteriales bacterium]